MPQVSRKKFQEVLSLCKKGCKNERLPFAQRMRAAELICLVYGLDLPGGTTKRDRKTVKVLLDERELEKQLKAQRQKPKAPLIKGETVKREIAQQEARNFLKRIATGVTEGETHE